MDRDALLAALPDMVPQLCHPEIEWIEDPRENGKIRRYREFYDEPTALDAAGLPE